MLEMMQARALLVVVPAVLVQPRRLSRSLDSWMISRQRASCHNVLPLASPSRSHRRHRAMMPLPVQRARRKHSVTASYTRTSLTPWSGSPLCRMEMLNCDWCM